MKRIAKRLILPLIAIVLVLALVLSGCSSNSAYVTSIAIRMARRTALPSKTA